jgi:hypothetical protein
MSESLPPVPAFDLEAFREAIASEQKYTFVATIDNVVVRTFSVDADAAAVFGHNPVFVQVPNGSEIPLGSTWDGETFTNSWV